MKYDPLKHVSLSPEQLEDALEQAEQERRQPRKMRREKKYRPPNEGVRRHQPGALPPFEES
jgi:hypothetical protein